MKHDHKFLVIKDKDTKEISYFDYEKIKGYNLKAREELHFKDAIDIKSMVIINPSFMDKIATQKLNGKFEKLVNLTSYVCENDDDEGEGYYIALNEISKLKMELINKYKKYISDEKYELMLRKIEILEDEIKLRINFLKYNMEKNKSEEKTEGKSR